MGIMSFFGFGQSAALSNRYGRQVGVPSVSLIDNTVQVGVDGAMQIATVWRAVEIIAKMISTLPIMVYSEKDGVRDQARDDSLWTLLHDQPNMRQTPVEFWTAMLLNLLLRGNAYAEIIRNPDGSAYAMMVRAADQITFHVGKQGGDYYEYITDGQTRRIDSINMLHIKEMTGTHIGMSRLEYMRSSLNESRNTQTAADTLFARGGRTTGILSPAGTITDKQWGALQERINDLVGGNKTIQVLPGDMKFNQINLTPQDIQLLSTRQFTVQEISRWFGVPPILLSQTEGTTTLGSSAEDIIDSFYDITIAPIVKNIEQAIRLRVMTIEQRRRLTAEFNMDAVMRSNPIRRMDYYSKGVSNGLLSRRECRKKENLKPFPGDEIFTVQSNLLPIDMLGQQTAPASQSQMTNTAQ